MVITDLGLPFALSTIGCEGAEPAIVLPGGPCRGPEYLEDLAGVGDERALVVLHPRGTPASGGLSRGWWSDAADVVALADALQLDAVDLIAHSAGTRLALAVAVRFPERVRSMALVTPPASRLSGTPTDADELAAERNEPAVLEALRAMRRGEPHTEEAYRETFRRQAPASYARWTAVEQAHAAVGAVSLAAATAWFKDIPADAIERIHAAQFPPTLVIGGELDLLTGVQPVRDYAAALAAQLALIPDCGHYPWVEQPEHFQQLLLEWLYPSR